MEMISDNLYYQWTGYSVGDFLRCWPIQESLTDRDSGGGTFTHPRIVGATS